jgi:hypothetical protein
VAGEVEVKGRLHEVALTPEEIRAILSVCGSRALLVGGQALAFWAAHYSVEAVGELSGKITSDADFIGTRHVAEKLRAAMNWTIWLPSIDDMTEQTAKVTTQVSGGGVKQVDFLRAVVGLDTVQIQSRAVEATLPSGAIVRILHPLDVLESRLRNLQALPSKRNAAGIAQAELAVGVVGAYLDQLLMSGDGSRVVLDSVERVIAMALEKRLIPVMVDYNIEPLSAVPWSKINAAEFQAKRKPQVLALAAEARRKYTERVARRRPDRKGIE